MTYIKLLTVLAGLALLTACGGSSPTTPANNSTGGDNSGGDNSGGGGGGGGGNATDCTQTPFHADCLTNNAPALLLRQTMCLASATTDDSCGAVIEGVCMDDPFHSNNTCTADTYLPNRIAECIKGGEADEGKCATITTDTEKNPLLTSCLENPFDIVCKTSVTDFVTYADTARMNRLDFCDDNANVANDFCTGNNVVIICGIDPFNAICFTDDTYFPNRVNNCIMAGNAGESKCNTLLSDATMNTELNACLTNPFATACESVTAFTSFALARTNRLTFCNDNMNVANTLCMGASRMGVCGSNPFNASCLTDKTYLPMRLGECIKTENAEDMRCNTLLSDSTMNTTITACLTNPFSDACAMNSDFTTYADDARTNRLSFCGVSGNESKAPCTALTTCQGNPFGTGCGAYFESAKIPHCAIRGNKDNGECTTTLSRPNAATWAQSFATELRTEAFNAAEQNADNNHRGHFLQGTADGLNRGDDNTNLITNTLNFDTAFDDDNMTDGFAYFEGSGVRYYAGIFSGTDLGAPVTGTNGTTVIWNGFIRNTSGGFGTQVAFELTVGFTGTGGTLDAFIPRPNLTTQAFTIDGDFDVKGVITGTVERGIYTDTSVETPVRTGGSAGQLSGLIGQEGAVAVFVSDLNVASPFSGGFVAKPPE